MHNLDVNTTACTRMYLYSSLARPLTLDDLVVQGGHMFVGESHLLLQQVGEQEQVFLASVVVPMLVVLDVEPGVHVNHSLLVPEMTLRQRFHVIQILIQQVGIVGKQAKISSPPTPVVSGK